MMQPGKVSTLVVLTLIAVFAVGPLIAQQAESTAGEDVYESGTTVRVSDSVAGDVIVAAGSVTIDSFVSEDVVATGGLVSITGNVGDDLRTSGAVVNINGDIGGDLAAAALFLTLESGSTVNGDAWLIGRTVTVAGNVNQTLSVNGEKVVLSGTYGGDVEVHANSIGLAPSAVIKGDLTYSAPGEAVIEDGAVIEGEVIREETDLSDPETWAAEALGSLKFYFGLALCAIVLLLVYPNWFEKVIERSSEAPFKSVGLGFVVLVVTPALAILLLISGLGAALGLITLGVALATVVAGILVGIVCVGDAGFRALGQSPDQSKWVRVGSIVAAAAVLMLIGFVPYGGWVFFIVLLLGIGAMKRYFYRQYADQEG